MASESDQVRLLIADVGGESGNDFIFSDEEIDEFLALKESNVFQASALALRTIAVNEAQVHKRIRFLELQTDGPATADALLKAALQLEEMDEAGSDFEIAEMGVDTFSRRYLRMGDEN